MHAILYTWLVNEANINALSISIASAYIYDQCYIENYKARLNLLRWAISWNAYRIS